MKRSTLQGRLAIAFVALAAVTAIGMLLAVVTAVRLYDAQSRVTDDFFSAYSLASDLEQALLDQETGFRGYVLTRDDEFLEPYLAGQRRAEEAGRRLDGVEQALPELRASRLAVQRSVESWRTQSVDPALATVRSGGTVSEAQLLSAKRGFDAVRAATADYQAEILDRRTTSVRDLRRADVVLFAGVGLGVVLLASTAALLWVALRRWVTQPLQRLGHEVDRVEGGDLSHRVELPDVPEEIRVLAEQVDHMRVRIVQQYDVAEAARQEALDARRLVEEQAEDLRRSNTELEQFAYVASHDLQEPLRKVASFCQLIERRYKGKLDERGEQYIEFAVDGAKRMQLLINDLLAFSRVGRLTNEFTLVPLDDVLGQALRQLEMSITETGATVTSDPLPVVRGEAGLLVQLFQNLVGNGIKFRGDEPPRVHIAVRRDGPMWEFACSDNGIGVEPQYAAKIFVIFQRLHGRDAYGGTGIGLAMCKKIVEYHGGRMWLDSAVSDGATFRWTLPVDDERNATDDADAARPADRGPVGGGRPG
ncbi:MAG TPA: ATP-binding protein [Actinomycetes bacterium]